MVIFRQAGLLGSSPGAQSTEEQMELQQNSQLPLVKTHRQRDEQTSCRLGNTRPNLAYDKGKLGFLCSASNVCRELSTFRTRKHTHFKPGGETILGGG